MEDGDQSEKPLRRDISTTVRILMKSDKAHWEINCP